MTTRTNGLTKHIPEGRRFFLTVFGRIEFEVTREEYKRAFTRLLTTAYDTPTNDDTALVTSFNTQFIDGIYKDPMPEEGVSTDA